MTPGWTEKPNLHFARFRFKFCAGNGSWGINIRTVWVFLGGLASGWLRCLMFVFLPSELGLVPPSAREEAQKQFKRNLEPAKRSPSNGWKDRREGVMTWCYVHEKSFISSVFLSFSLLLPKSQRAINFSLSSSLPFFSSVWLVSYILFTIRFLLLPLCSSFQQRIDCLPVPFLSVSVRICF